MANYKLSNDYWETSGIYDIGQGKTQREINADLKTSAESTIKPETASGGVASFEGGEGVPLKSLVVNIEPAQAGSGDPSPTNIRPITGWTGANVAIASERIFDDSITIMQGGLSSSDGGATTTNYRIRAHTFIPVKPSTKYKIYTNLPYFSVHEYGTASTEQYIGYTGSWVNSGYEFTATGNTNYIRIAFANSTAASGGSAILVTPDDLIYCNIIEDGKGSQYSISFPAGAGTVYGGTLDVTNGVLRVDGVKKVLDGTETWQRQEGQYAYYIHTLGDINTGISNYVVSDRFKQVSIAGGTNNQGINVFNSSGFNKLCLFLRYDALNLGSVSDLTTWLANNNTTIIYKLSTPVEYTLTPTEVKAVLGQNNVWADCGDVNVQYGAYLTVVENQLGEKIPKLMLAPVEKTTTASKAYSVNEFLIMDDKLYIVTSPITSGGTITVGTNVAETTIGEQITALLNG